MKRTLNIFAGLAVAITIVALLTPASFAQCPSAREFGALAGGMNSPKIRIDVSGFLNNGSESAQFWETGNPANGTGVGASGSCDSQGPAPVGWWNQQNDPNQRGIRGFLSQPGCSIPLCPLPGASLTFLIEDETADGQGSGFIMYTVDDTPAGFRWYDLSRTDPNQGEGSLLIHSMGTLPSVVIQGSSGPPPNTNATTDYPEDVGIVFHGVQGPLNTPLPASAQIDSYDVMSASGADPGRDRSNWTLVKKINYSDAAVIADSLDVPCTGDQPTFIAIGLTFDGGVESSRVGPPSLAFNCDPNIADPDLDTPKVRRPSFTNRPGRSGR